MTSPRFARGTKSRVLAYLGFLLLFLAVLFLYHNARGEINAGKEAVAKCQQTQESLSAQLQVIFEYKVRLEKNLNEEKHRHQETKDKLATHISDDQERNKENKEAHNKYAALQQQYKFLQTQFDDHQAESEKAQANCEAQIKSVETKAAADLEKLKTKQSEVQEEADANQKHLRDLQNTIKDSNSAVELYKKNIDELKKENEGLKRQLETLEKRQKGAKSSTDRGGAAGPDAGVGVAEAPAGALAAPIPGRPPSSSSSVATPDGRQGMNAVIADQLAASNSKALGKQSTTPQINPEALLSQEKAGHGGVAGGVAGGVLAPPVAPAPPSDLGQASQGPQGQQRSAFLRPKNIETQDTQQQQQGAVLPMPLHFQHRESQLQPGVAVAAAPPAVIPAQPPPQQHFVRDSPTNQGQPPPLYDAQGIFQAPIPIQRNLGFQRGWDNPLQRSADLERRDPVAAPVEGRGREERLGADWGRQPFQGGDYDKEVHLGENEEDDDDDVDPMDNAVNVVRPIEKKSGGNKFLGRNMVVNPR